jgi:integrase
MGTFCLELLALGGINMNGFAKISIRYDRNASKLLLLHPNFSSSIVRLAKSRHNRHREKVIRFSEAAARFLEEGTLRASTVKMYSGLLHAYLLPRFGDLRVDHLCRQDILQFQLEIARTVSASRANKVISLLRSVMKWCLVQRLLSQNPCNGVRRLQESRPKIDPFTKCELESILSEVPPHYCPLFTCLAWTGARPGELYALRWKDVDFERAEINIDKGRVFGQEDLPKTYRSNRVVPMLSPVKQALLTLARENEHQPNDYVFTRMNGRPINKHLNHLWKAAVGRAGERHRPSYQLRHTFASLCLEAGVDPAWLANVLGHHSPRLTFRCYAKFVPGFYRENLMRVEQSL